MQRCSWCHHDGLPDDVPWCPYCRGPMPSPASYRASATGPSTGSWPSGAPTAPPFPDPFTPPGPREAPGARAAFLEGIDWRAAVRPAAAGLLALAALPLLSGIVLLVSQPALGLGAFLATTLAGVAQAVGGSVEFGAGIGPLRGGMSIGVMPLSATLAGLVVLGKLFADRLPGRADSLPATVRQGAATLLLFVAGLLAVAVLGNLALDTLLSGNLVGTLAGVEVSIGVGGTLVGGVLLGAAALVVAVLWKHPEVLPGRAREVREALVGPAVAVRVTLALAAVATVVVALVVLAASSRALTTGSGETANGVAIILAALVADLPNVVLTALGFGSWVPIALDLPAPLGMLAGAGGIPTSYGLGDVLATDGHWWFVPVLVAVCLVAGAVRMALTAADRHRALRQAWRLAPVWAGVLLLGAVLSGIGVRGSGPLPVLGQISLSGGVHLSYGISLLAGAVWGLVAGVAGALVARALPPDVVDGYRHRVPGRRAAVVGVVIALLCALSIPTAWAATQSVVPTPPPVPVPVPTPTTYPYPTPYPPPAPTQDLTRSSTVALGPGASADPHASTVRTVLGRYFDAINGHDYDGWSAVVTPKVAQGQSRSSWLQGYSSTHDDQIVVDEIGATSAGDALATVSFRSTQDPADAPPSLPVGRICWTVTYPVDLTTSEVGPAQRSSMRMSAC